MAQTKAESKSESSWKAILTDWDLAEFETKFKENGFTDITDWIHINDTDMAQLGFKKGHKLRFVRKLKQFISSPRNADSFEGKHDDIISMPHNSQISEYGQTVCKPQLLGGDSWIELGEFRLGQVDGAHFSISHKINKKTCMIFRSDGTIHPGPRNDVGLFDKEYTKDLKNVLFGDGWLQLGAWRIVVCDRDHLSISHQSRKTCMIWRADGTRHKGPRQDFHNYWNRDVNNSAYGTYYVLDKNSDNKYIKWIQFGDNWRIGDVDTDHFSISANRVFFKWGQYLTTVIYRRDGTVWPGPRNDLGLWSNKRKYQILSSVMYDVYTLTTFNKRFT